MMRTGIHIAPKALTLEAKVSSPPSRKTEAGLPTESDGERIVRCPHCGSDAYYRYGKSANGKKRYLCLSCNKQYTLDREGSRAITNRPLCPSCQSRMHIYRKETGVIRFRCGNYPECRTFVKIAP